MEIKIRLARAGQARDCLACIKHSELWEIYFKSNAAAEDVLREMIDQRQIHVALNKNNNCIGFMGIVDNGCFRKFAYLSLIAIKRRYRGKGIGSALIDKFEEIGFTKANRVFLLVSDFNDKAQRLYRRQGYRKVGKIPDLYKKGVAEHILVKYET